jgi:phage-related protein
MPYLAYDHVDGSSAQAGDLDGRFPAKPLKGFGAGVLEVLSDRRGDTFRAVYTVRLAGTVYVLHAFQKKSTKGTATPRRELDLVNARLKLAEELHRKWEKQ